MTGTNRAIASLKGLLILVGQCLIILFLGFVARECWRAYQQEKMEALFAKEGRPVAIVVDKVTREKLTWKDYIGNSKYIGFMYKGRAYSTRYVQDSAWVGEGSKLVLFYHEGLDAFRQQGLKLRRESMYKKSRIVDWTVISLFSLAHAWLFAFLVLCTILFIFGLGIISNLTGLEVLSRLQNIVIIAVFLAGALYFSFDAYQYYRYVHQVKSHATKLDVVLVDKGRTTFNHSGDDWLRTYWYTATVLYAGENRVIAISERDYDEVKPNSPLDVLYNQPMDEMVSARYSYDYSPGLLAITCWILLIFGGLQKLRKRND